MVAGSFVHDFCHGEGAVEDVVAFVVPAGHCAVLLPFADASLGSAAMAVLDRFEQPPDFDEGQTLFRQSPISPPPSISRLLRPQTRTTNGRISSSEISARKPAETRIPIIASRMCIMTVP